MAAVVALDNLCSGKEAVDREVRSDLEADCRGECGRWGTVARVHCPLPPAHARSGDVPARIFVEFPDEEVAARVVAAFDGRTFAGRVVSARVLGEGEAEGYGDAEEEAPPPPDVREASALPAPPPDVSAVAHAAQGAFDVGDYANATRLYSDAIRASPKTAALWLARARCHAQLALHDKACDDANEAARLAPASAHAHAQLGACLSSLGRNAMAARAYANAYRLAPDDAGIQARLRAALASAKARAGPVGAVAAPARPQGGVRNEHGLLRQGV